MKGRASKRSAIVYGASGHGKVVADILHVCGMDVEGFVDDSPKVSQLNILGDGKWLAEQASLRPLTVALGIGNNFDRRTVAERLISSNIPLLTAVHPTATIATSAKISPGVVIMAHAVVNADAFVGPGAIINTGAIVEHDCRVGSYAHLSPKAAIGGHVEVGDLAWLGIGSSVIPNLKIGEGAIVGAGATVVNDIEEWVLAVGTPARVSKQLARVV
ncbi:MAG TPA: acetyltransferase [Silvibacterium sp.]|nr:acetyltransferase [Silvibacterium sp.]